MKIALAQINIIWENKSANISRCERIISKAKEHGVEFILFPEMTLTGFSMNTEATAESDDYTERTFNELSEKYEISIGFGVVKKASNSDDKKNVKVKCENHYMFSRAGKIILDYTKIHPFSYSGEDEYFEGGKQLFYTEIEKFDVGAVICYDLRFPEIFQILSANANLIIVPANWPNKRSEHWKLLLQARALENQCYIAGINCAGMMFDQYYSGDSAIYSPEGKLLQPTDVFSMKSIGIDACCEEEVLLIYDITNDVGATRNAFPVKNDRRRELYRNMDAKKCD